MDAEVKITMVHPIVPNWKTNIYQQIKQRNANEGGQFQKILSSYNGLLEKSKTLEEKNSQLDKEVSRLTLLNNDLQRKSTSISASASPNSQIIVAELEKKVQKLQEDLTLSYKRNSDNATTMLELNQQVKVLEEDVKNKEVEIEDWKTRLSESEQHVKKLEDEVQEKDLTMQVLQEELKALQVEFVKMDEKVKQLTAENNDLVTRWMQLKNEQAATMNDAMEEAQKIISDSKKAALLQRLETSTLEPVKFDMRGSVLDNLARLDSSAIVPPTKVKRSIEAHKGEIFSIAFNKTGTLLGTGGGGTDNNVKIWDVKMNCMLKSTLFGPTQSVMCVDFSSNDDMILGASNDNIVRLWSVQYGRVKHTLTGHEGKVVSAQFSGDAQRVVGFVLSLFLNRKVSGSADRTIKMWDLQKGYCIRTIFCLSSCNTLCLNPSDSRFICSGHFDHQLRFWDSRSGECAQEVSGIHNGQITSVQLTQDGNQILTNSRDNTVKLIDIRTYDVVSTFTDENYRNGTNWNNAVLSFDGSYIATGGMDGKLYVWNRFTGKLESNLKSSQGATIFNCAWSPLGQLASVDKTGYITMWA